MSKKRSAAAAFIVLGVVVLGLAAAVYAKYVSTIQATGEISVAKWAFTSDNTDGGTVECVLSKTYNAATLVADKIAPGTSGKCPIVVSNENTEVGIRYTITPSTDSAKPVHLKFYTDEEHTTELASGDSITDTLRPQETSPEVYVYWYWPYEDDPSTAAYDEVDTNDGETKTDVTITFDITGTQVKPE